MMNRQINKIMSVLFFVMVKNNKLIKFKSNNQNLDREKIV
jgi:hypothetical protein